MNQLDREINQRAENPAWDRQMAARVLRAYALEQRRTRLGRALSVAAAVLLIVGIAFQFKRVSDAGQSAGLDANGTAYALEAPGLATGDELFADQSDAELDYLLQVAAIRDE